MLQCCAALVDCDAYPRVRGDDLQLSCLFLCLSYTSIFVALPAVGQSLQRALEHQQHVRRDHVAAE
jgi:hypothetical protein